MGVIDPETVENWANVRLGHEAMMLDKIQRQNRIVEDTVRGQQAELGYESHLEDDDMGVSVGNKTYNYNVAPAEKSGVVEEVSRSAASVSKKGSSALGAALAAAALASGGTGLGAYALHKVLTRTTLSTTEPVEIPRADPGFGTPVWRDHAKSDTDLATEFIPRQ